MSFTTQSTTHNTPHKKYFFWDSRTLYMNESHDTTHDPQYTSQHVFFFLGLTNSVYIWRSRKIQVTTCNTPHNKYFFFWTHELCMYMNESHDTTHDMQYTSQHTLHTTTHYTSRLYRLWCAVCCDVQCIVCGVACVATEVLQHSLL